jgi:hypothetical protein
MAITIATILTVLGREYRAQGRGQRQQEVRFSHISQRTRPHARCRGAGLGLAIAK